MKVMFIGHYRDGTTGWAYAAQNFIRALDAAGVEVVPRWVKLNNSAPSVHPKVEELEKKSADGASVVIQNVLPHHMEYVAGVKNIGLIFTEGETLHGPWISRLNLMDEIWTCNLASLRCLIRSGVRVPVKVFDVPVDLSEYVVVRKPFNIPELRDKYVFYAIGEFTKRKNFEALVKAYSLAFRPTDNVALILKVGKFGVSPEQLRDTVNKWSLDIKRSLKTPVAVNEIVITDNLSRENILNLHATGDCLMVPSYAEGYSLPMVDAILTGNAVLTTKYGGPDETFEGYVESVESSKERCSGESDNFPFLFTGQDSWRAISVPDLIDQMCFKALGSRLKRPNKDRVGELSERLSFVSVGSQMAQRLKEIV